MAELFGVDVRTANEHLQNIYISRELERESTIRKIRIVQNMKKFHVAQDKNFESDFDKEVKRIASKSKGDKNKKGKE